MADTDDPFAALPDVDQWSALPAAKPDPADPYSGLLEAEDKITPEQRIRRDALKALIAAQGQPGYTQRAQTAGTMSLGGPLFAATVAAPLGAAGSALGLVKPASYGDYYRGYAGAESDYANLANKNTNPYLGAATDLAGGLASAGPVAGQAISTGKGILQGLGTGAVEGGAQNAHTNLEDAGWGASIGGALGAAGSAILGGLTNRLSSVQKAVREAGEASRGPTAEAFKEASGKLFKQLDDAGVAFDFNQTQAIGPALKTALDAGYNPGGVHAGLKSIVDDLNKIPGEPASYTQLKLLRDRITSETQGPDKNVRRMARDLRDVLDRFVDTTPPAMNPSGIDVGKMSSQARDMWKRGSQVEDNAYLSQKAQNTVSGTDNPLDDAQRGVFRGVLNKVDKPGAYNPYSKESMDTIRNEIVPGTRMQNALRTGGAILKDPATLGVGGIAALAPGAIGYAKGEGDPVSSALSGVGAIAAMAASRGAGRSMQKVAGELGQRGVDKLIRGIAGDAPGLATNPLSREALAKLVARAQAQRLGGQYAGSWTPQFEEKPPQ